MRQQEVGGGLGGHLRKQEGRKSQEAHGERRDCDAWVARKNGVQGSRYGVVWLRVTD